MVSSRCHPQWPTKVPYACNRGPGGPVQCLRVSNTQIETIKALLMLFAIFRAWS